MLEVTVEPLLLSSSLPISVQMAILNVLLVHILILQHLDLTLLLQVFQITVTSSLDLREPVHFLNVSVGLIVTVTAGYFKTLLYVKDVKTLSLSIGITLSSIMRK